MPSAKKGTVERDLPIDGRGDVVGIDEPLRPERPIDLCLCADQAVPQDGYGIRESETGLKTFENSRWRLWLMRGGLHGHLLIRI